MSKMKEVAHLLSVELEEEFQTRYLNLTLKFTEKGLFYKHKKNNLWIDSKWHGYLHDLLTGEDEIIKFPILSEKSKSIPKKLIQISKSEGIYECPICGKEFYKDFYDYEAKYCWNCGQCLDWSDDDGARIV